MLSLFRMDATFTFWIKTSYAYSRTPNGRLRGHYRAAQHSGPSLYPSPSPAGPQRHTENASFPYPVQFFCAQSPGCSAGALPGPGGQCAGVDRRAVLSFVGSRVVGECKKFRWNEQCGAGLCHHQGNLRAGPDLARKIAGRTHLCGLRRAAADFLRRPKWCLCRDCLQG